MKRKRPTASTNNRRCNVNISVSFSVSIGNRGGLGCSISVDTRRWYNRLNAVENRTNLSSLSSSLLWTQPTRRSLRFESVFLSRSKLNSLKVFYGSERVFHGLQIDLSKEVIDRNGFNQRKGIGHQPPDSFHPKEEGVFIASIGYLHLVWSMFGCTNW